MTMHLTRYISRRETAEHLGIHEHTLDNWYTSGYGPPRYKLRGRVVYRLEEVDTWVTGQTNPTTEH